MEIIKKRITDMERAEYNPRVELMPGDDEYEKLKRNIERFGMVVLSFGTGAPTASCPATRGSPSL